MIFKRFLQQRPSHVDGQQVLQKAIDCVKRCCDQASATMSEQPAPSQPSFDTLVIGLTGLDNVLVDAYGKFLADAGRALGAIVGSPRTLPPAIERWSVLSSPHVHKTAWTQFERRTHQRTVRFGNLHPELVGRMIWYSKVHVPPDVQLAWTVNRLTRMSEL